MAKGGGGAPEIRVCGPRGLLAIAAALLSACSAYDSDLLTDRDVFPSGRGPTAGTAAGVGGAGGSSGAMSPNGGASAAATDAATDAGGTSGDAGGGDVMVEPCGDGKITEGESCDVAIAEGQPGACPSECPPVRECQPRELQGSRCEARCVDVALECTGGDGCCPAECSNAEDDDCSASCGDGVVQPDAGETCEVASGDGETPAEPCPTECPDDGDPCTAETLTGSADNCNATCVTTVIDTVGDGDECCPEGANSTLDADCPVLCGNGIIEEGEDCDGGPNCDDECNSTVVTEPQRCMSVFTEVATSCRECMCNSCTAATNNCFASGNTRRDADCAELVYCGLEAGCRGAQCYCGLSTDPDGTCIVGNGPCKELMERIAGAPGPLPVYNQQFDPNTAIGRARAFSECHGASCTGACD